MKSACCVPGCRVSSEPHGAVVEWLCADGHAYMTSYDTLEELLLVLKLGDPQLFLSLDVPTPPPTPPVETRTRAHTLPETPLVMPFGKHRGEPIEDLPEQYLRWLLDECDGLREELREEVENQLALKQGRGVSRRRR